MNPKALYALAFVLVGLLAAVIIVGLAQKTLDTTGVATVLGGLLSGVVAGIVLREKGKGP